MSYCLYFSQTYPLVWLALCLHPTDVKKLTFFSTKTKKKLVIFSFESHWGAAKSKLHIISNGLQQHPVIVGRNVNCGSKMAAFRLKSR